ncbi:hypothetical protein WNY37_07955 [Henriciella sp. AS95]|uniref:hypothetical protein n=1 Tax=Henriciella sp. AS95 TaxID=3135782 RepID=UPI003178125B
MTTRRVKLKLGLAEVEIEGEQDNLHEEALGILERMVDMVPAQPVPVQTAPLPPANIPAAALGNQSVTSEVQANFDFSVDAIASHRKSSSASDLAVAASIYLYYVTGQVEFSRTDILDAMKTATSFYKENMRGNHTKTLRVLVKNGVLLSRSSGKYALSNATRSEAEASLAELG